MAVKLSLQDGSLERVYHNMMLSSKWFLTKGRGKKKRPCVNFILLFDILYSSESSKFRLSCRQNSGIKPKKDL